MDAHCLPLSQHTPPDIKTTDARHSPTVLEKAPLEHATQVESDEAPAFTCHLEGCKHALGIYSNEACCVWRAFEMQCRFTHSQMQSTMASNAPAELEKVPLKHGIHVELKAAPV